MKTVHEWLRKQKASEIMTKTVTCLRPSDRLEDAVNLFLRDQISGAPVVDDQEVCIGVLSATDIVSFEEKRATTPNERPSIKRPHFDTWDAGAQWWLNVQRVREELQPRLEESVIGYMTRDIVSVSEDTPLGVVIRQMVDAHVHRVLVLDSARRLVGLITTMDILAAALRAGRREPAVSQV
jgi:CBS domain-containing protein